jgi:hypothetical protein
MSLIKAILAIHMPLIEGHPERAEFLAKNPILGAL